MNRKESNVTNVEDLEALINRIKNNLDEILPKPSAPANNSPSKVFLIKLRELHNDVDALKEVIETRVSFNTGSATVLSSLKRRRKTRKTCSRH
jgi:hypothetical protein